MTNLEKELWDKVKRYMKYIKWVPGLRMVAVCNNLAFGTIDERSDIDLFVVAREGRLFTVRLFVTGILHLLGVRRHGNKIKGRFCLSFFVDDSSLNLKPIAIRDDIYLAYWIRSMKPVIDDGVSDEFFTVNGWIRDYFNETGLYLDKSHLIYKKKAKKSGLGSLLKPAFFGLIPWAFEKRFRYSQLRSARHKASKLADISGTVINDHMLKFHDKDMRKKYRNLWIDKYGDKKLSEELFKHLI
ncbi:MAG: hypothetical protein WC269_01720 [Candidatus Gracilibacteria bacterium]|jgi:hypothetical protein